MMKNLKRLISLALCLIGVRAGQKAGQYLTR